MNRRRQVIGACHSRVLPTPVRAPEIIAWTESLARRLGLPTRGDTPAMAKLFGGNATVANVDSYAACYGGHQFGHWAGQLGDGRAINLGAVRGVDGRHWILRKQAPDSWMCMPAAGSCVSLQLDAARQKANRHLHPSRQAALGSCTSGNLILYMQADTLILHREASELA